MTAEDVLAFGKYHLAHSPTAKKQIRRSQFLSVLLAFIMVGLIIIATHKLDFLLSAVIASAILFVITPALVRWKTYRRIRQLFQEDKRQGQYVLEIHPDGLYQRSGVHEVKTAWQGLEVAGADKNHTFIYNTSLSAYVIPHDKITEGNLQEFLQDVEQHRAFADRLPTSG